jgi:anti-sigma B factor antagonist
VATFVSDLAPAAFRAECDRCGWESAPVHRELARVWAAEHRVRCPYEPLAEVPLTATVRQEGDAVVVGLRGEFDASVAQHVRAQIQSVLETGVGTVVVDMREVTFIDSTGLGVLAGAARRARSCGTRLLLRGPTRATRRVLDLTGLAETFEIC